MTCRTAANEAAPACRVFSGERWMVVDRVGAMRHVVFVGPQGAGKGTQAAAVAPQVGLVHLATGDLLRDLMASDSPLAREVQEIYDRGDLVPDATMARILFSSLDVHSSSPPPRGALIDGFPRNAEQAEVLDGHIYDRGDELVAVIHISVPRDVLMKRLTGRLICRDCGRSYHREFNPPSRKAVCDHCGGELYTRSDDTEEAVARRLEIYFAQTEPLLDRWRERGLVTDVDGNRSIHDVTNQILPELKPHFEGER